MSACRRSSIIIAAVLLVSAAGCRGSKIDDSASEDSAGPPVTYALTDAGIEASLRDHMTDVGDDLNMWVPTEEEAACAAQRLVDRFGANRLIAIGYDPESGSLALAYEPIERDAAVNVLTGCIDFSRGMLEMMTAYSKTPLAAAECITRGMETAGLSRLFAESLVDGEEPDVLAADAALGRGFSELMVKCMDIDDLDPLLPLPQYPGAFDSATTTVPEETGDGPTTTNPGSAGAEGIVPAGGG